MGKYWNSKRTRRSRSWEYDAQKFDLIIQVVVAILRSWWYCVERVLLSVYKIKGLKASSETFRKVKEGMWSQLQSNDENTTKIRSIVEEGMMTKVGNGTSVRFWHDHWCEVGVLSRIFPRLYAISLQKNSFISQMGNWSDDVWVWNLRWRRILYERENEAVATLKHQIEQIRT